MFKRTFGPSLSVSVLLIGISFGQTMEPCVIEIVISEFRFQPTTIHLSIGKPVHLILANHGQQTHEFESALFLHHDVKVHRGGNYFEGSEIKEITVGPGGRVDILFTPQTLGSYPFACEMAGHGGMKGTIDVE